MAIKIAIPDAAWSESSPSLGGITYDITFRFNDRDIEDPHWRMDIRRGSVDIRLGVKVVPYLLLLDRYTLDDFNHGDIICVRSKSDYSPVGRDNFGIGKAYELIYLTNQEINDWITW